MESKGRLFERPGKSIQKITKICFYVCLVLAIILFAIGLIKCIEASTYGWSISEILATTSYVFETKGSVDDMAYTGKNAMTAAVSLVAAAIFCICLYAFGNLVDDVAACKAQLMLKAEKDEDNT